MSYTRIIHTTNNKSELYQLGIMADFSELTYSVVVMYFNHSHTGDERYIIETFPNIFEATREYHRLIAEHQNDKDLYKKFFETAKAKAKPHV